VESQSLLRCGIINEILDLLSHFVKLLGVAVTQSLVTPGGVKGFRNFLTAKVFQVIFIGISVVVDSLFEKLVEIEVVLDQKGNGARL
jgi:hypothetical protein